MKAVETTLIGFRSRGAEIVLSFAVQKDDVRLISGLCELIGHNFTLDIEKIDYDNPQPAQEGQQRHDPARAKLHARVGILSKDPGFFLWAQRHYPQYATSDMGPGAIRGFCQVKSRSEILPGTQAELRFNLLESAYNASTMGKA